MNTGLSEKHRKEMAHHLNILLANEYVLYTKTLKYHWNVEGKWFGQLHAMFNKQYEELLEVADTVAERVRALEHEAFGTLHEFAKATSIKETPGKNPKDVGMIKDLLDGYEIIIKQVREITDFSAKINDMGTNNMLCDLLEKHEKTAWMLRAHLQ